MGFSGSFIVARAGRPLTELAAMRASARAARNTAMMEALADLPPVVIADLIGIHPGTATRWARFAGDSWADYLAARPT